MLLLLILQVYAGEDAATLCLCFLRCKGQNLHEPLNLWLKTSHMV